MSKRVSILILAAVLLPFALAAQETAITYQGQLRESGEPFTGTANLQFQLFDALVDGNEIGAAVTRTNWPVEDGLFQVELDFGPAVFDGSQRFLEVWINGAPLNPRQKVTATPFALLAAGTASGAVDGTAIDPAEVQLRVGGACAAGQAIRQIGQDGSVTCEADDIGASGWNLTGNAGTDPNTNFIGTTDASALELRTANVRGLRIEPSAELFDGLPITANVIAGSRANEVSPGVRGATIAGGGVPDGDSDPDFIDEFPNRVTGHYGTVGGGFDNQAGDDDGNAGTSPFSTVGGGSINRAFGFASTVGGGQRNNASGGNSTVGGGRENNARGGVSTVGGGVGNWASTSFSTVSGGLRNTVSGGESTVGGGSYNTASGVWSTVGGGNKNTASGGTFSTVGGGFSNTASGDQSTVGGGETNTASGGMSTVGGGFENTASGQFSAVIGGSLNCAGGANSWAGGGRAKVRPGSSSGDPGGGCIGVPETTASYGDRGTFVWADSRVEDFISTGADQFLVRAAGGMGINTNAPQRQLHVKQLTPYNNTSGITLERSGTSGDQWGLYVSTTNSFVFVANNSGRASINPNTGAYTTVSDRRAKRDIEPLDGVLDRFLQLRPSRYRMKHQDGDASRSIGLIAQEVQALFPEAVSNFNGPEGHLGLRYDEITVLNTQALIELNQRHETRFRQQETRIAAMAGQVETLVQDNKRLRAVAERNSELEARLAVLEALLLEDRALVGQR